jgi:hypothetical protein
MDRWFYSILPAFLIVFLGNTVAVVADDQPPLHGQVQRNAARIERPGSIKSGRDARAPLNQDAGAPMSRSLNGNINDASFSRLPTSTPAAALDAQANTPLSEDPIASPLDAGTRSDKLEDKATQTAAAPAVSASKPDQSTTTTSSTPSPAPKNFATSKSITIRLKRFRGLLEMEVVWEAANLAIKMQSKGADVTLLLDMEAVNAANRHNTMFAEFQEHRGNGNSSEKLESVQALIRQFTDAGGRVLVAQRWAHYYSMDSDGSLIHGVKLVSDDEIADHLLDTGNILDY